MDLASLDFERDGVTVVREAFDASGMVDAFWGILGRRYRIMRDDPSTWPPGVFGKLTRFGKSGPFAGVATDAVRDAITGVFGGAAWHETERWASP